MVRELSHKYVYVDIDGTLAEYRFNGHVSAKDGTVNGQTAEETRNHIFLDSRPLKTVINTIKAAKTNGVWICGSTSSPIEVIDKHKWLKKYCRGIDFSGYYWFVPEECWEEFILYFDVNEQWKMEGNEEDITFYNEYGVFFKGSKKLMWDWIEINNIHSISETVFIDDVLDYVKYAEEKGVTAYHISSFIK